MNDRLVRGGEELQEIEMEGLVHKQAGQPQGQRTETQLYIRVATGHDGEKLRKMFSRASSETIYKRFHIPYQEVPEWMVALMLDTDHHDKESLVAVAEERIVGHAMYVRLEDDTEAEMAIVVEDGWQSKGLGRSLLSELVERARHSRHRNLYRRSTRSEPAHARSCRKVRRDRPHDRGRRVSRPHAASDAGFDRTRRARSTSRSIGMEDQR